MESDAYHKLSITSKVQLLKIMNKLIISGVIIMTLLTGCTKQINSILPNVYLDFMDKKGVYIGCEGNFMYGNASLSFYDKNEKKVYNQIFYNTNNFPIGDVLQSVKIKNDLLYLMVNNSGKIYIANKNNMTYQSKIIGLTSPRYINFIDDKKAYVTDLYSPAIAVINTESNEVINGIMIGFSTEGNVKSTEEMVRYKNKIFTCSWSNSNQVYRIDTKTNTIIDSIQVTKQPNSLVIDMNNKLWVMCDGSYTGSPYGKVNAALCRIDAETFTLEKTFTFSDDKVQPSRLNIDATGENIFYIYGTHAGGEDNYGVYKMSVEDNQISYTPFIEANDKIIYSLGIDHDNGDIYVGDAIDYAQAGVVYRYNKNAILIDSFKTGIIPSSFAFKY